MKGLEKDFSLKEGEKISISIKGITDSKTEKPVSAATGGGLKKLAPPKGLSKLPPPGGAKPKHEESKADDLLSLDAPSQKPSDDPLDGLF